MSDQAARHSFPLDIESAGPPLKMPKLYVMRDGTWYSEVTTELAKNCGKPVFACLGGQPYVYLSDQTKVDA